MCVCVSKCISACLFSSRPFIQTAFSWLMVVFGSRRERRCHWERINNAQGFGTPAVQTGALQLSHRSRRSGVCGELRRSVFRKRECGKDQRLLDYVWLNWNESFCTGRLKDHLESMSDYWSERGEGSGGKATRHSTLGGWYQSVKTAEITQIRRLLWLILISIFLFLFFLPLPDCLPSSSSVLVFVSVACPWVESCHGFYSLGFHRNILQRAAKLPQATNKTDSFRF